MLRLKGTYSLTYHILEPCVELINLVLIAPRLNQCYFVPNIPNLKNDVVDLSIDNLSVDCIDEMKHLSIVVDRDLSFEPHMDRLCSEISAKTGLLWCIGGFIDYSLAKMLHDNLIYLHAIANSY